MPARLAIPGRTGGQDWRRHFRSNAARVSRSAAGIGRVGAAGAGRLAHRPRGERLALFVAHVRKSLSLPESAAGSGSGAGNPLPAPYPDRRSAAPGRRTNPSPSGFHRSSANTRPAAVAPPSWRRNSETGRARTDPGVRATVTGKNPGRAGDGAVIEPNFMVAQACAPGWRPVEPRCAAPRRR